MFDEGVHNVLVKCGSSGFSYPVNRGTREQDKDLDILKKRKLRNWSYAIR